ncbi:hypothetical protein SAMN04487974_11440 [Pelagibacterium luteolum]|uniref:Uncharacterized protein n=1 Tax=Pelagibacterium luteolum TaxID=440168 RepID=A0A1G7YJ93_9HYPH|nr:hypothetical protein SAMN04487974_11440 [Pelagibacterium luteolum]
MIGVAGFRIAAQPGAPEQRDREGGDNGLGSWQDKSRTVRRGWGCGRLGIRGRFSHRVRGFRTVRQRDFALPFNGSRTAPGVQP